jgi:prephenate dehydrogenase
LRSLGVVDEITTSTPQACEGCDVVVVAAPVDRIAELVAEASAASPPDCLVTDVGSTKGGIVAALSADPIATGKFVAAHPIAGSEKSGPEYATATLFDGKLIVLTPGDRTDRTGPGRLDRSGSAAAGADAQQLFHRRLGRVAAMRLRRPIRHGTQDDQR